jgi:carboxymethylenebutenolidase
MSRRLVVLLSVFATAAFIAPPEPPPAQGPPLPAGAADAEARLKASPRHAEWATIKTSPTDSVVAWVVYPERRDKAPVVVVIHEIFGLSTWIRGVADQLAADGFIAIAPDLLTMRRSGDLTSEWSGDSARNAIRTLKPEDVQRDLSAVANYGMRLPAATQKYGVVGYCWGGSESFAHAVAAADVDAAVVYYGTSPRSDALQSVKAPVLGLYGGNDARVNATIAPADSVMKALGKVYEHAIYDGAGHGFLRQQDGQNGANMSATKQAWPRTIAFFRKHLAS